MSTRDMWADEMLEKVETLAAALRLVEWVEQDYRARKCGGCTGLDPEVYGAKGGHKPGCPVAAALALVAPSA